MTENRFQIIHLGNAYDFVLKDHQTNKTYGTFQGDDESMMEMLNDLSDENNELKKQNEELIKGMQDTARLSAKAITKPMVEVRWGKGVYDD